jgi:hypothetical protein
MFGINLSIFKQQQQPVIEVIEEGDSVIHEDGRVGTVKVIGTSPYWVEEIQGILRAYVVFEGSADWCLAGELAKTTTFAAIKAS